MGLENSAPATSMIQMPGIGLRIGTDVLLGLATVPCIVLGHLTPALLGKAIGNHLVRSWGRAPTTSKALGKRVAFGGKQSVCVAGHRPGNRRTR
jgi:hypothetical protein